MCSLHRAAVHGAAVVNEVVKYSSCHQIVEKPKSSSCWRQTGMTDYRSFQWWHRNLCISIKCKALSVEPSP